MRSSRRISLIAHLAGLAAMAGLAPSTGLPTNYVRKSPRKNAPVVVRVLPSAENVVRYPRKPHLHDLCRRRLLGRALA